MHEPSSLDVAVRVYPEIPGKERKPNNQTRWRPRPRAMLVLDTETRTDATQSLLFGCFRYIVDGQCLREALFYSEDLSSAERNLLKDYAASHPASVARGGRPSLDLLTVDEFLNELCRAGYKGKCLIVAFNVPFDLSRLCFDVAPSRREFAGGFSLGLWSYIDKKGRRKRNGFLPRVGIKHIDSKRAQIGFTATRDPDKSDLVKDEKTGKSRTFRGHFLDLRTLAFALTDRGHSLKSACTAFGIEQGKMDVKEHGKITDSYIDYCRRDVQATAELAQILLKEFDRHPIKLQETKALSPASIGKAYLRAMRISPVLDRQSNLHPFVGYAQSAFFGGRTSVHIRKAPVPVVYTDFLSMYPTVNSLMNLWQFVIAKEIRFRPDCKEEIACLLERIRVDELFKPETWKNLTAFVRVLPNGDVLPSRGRYSPETNSWQVAINHLYADKEEDALWFSLPDVVASVILTGRVPKIVDAFIPEPHGVLPGLCPTKLRGIIEIDPLKQDFFKCVIEERKRATSRTDISEEEKGRLDKALKVLANSASYGIYAEMNRHEANEMISVICHGIDKIPFSCRVQNPDIPGEFCFPPFASLITGAARLMLALLEKCVTDLGGTYAMEDTDSMAIVATERGGIIEYPKGSGRRKDGKKAITALSWKQVEGIAERFQSLNPYDKSAISGSILKIEEDNRDPETGNQRQLWCYAISAKRYALFLRDKKGAPELLRNDKNNKEDRWSEHGLGHLLNPIDLESEDRDWISQIWQKIICECPKNTEKKLNFEDVPAIGRFTITSPNIIRPLAALNKAKTYSDQIKPFNFLLTCHISPFGHPFDTNPEKFHLIAPYEMNSSKWLKMSWIDQYSGKTFRITTQKNYSSRTTARVNTYGDVFEDYAYHPESKSADEHGNTSDRQTVGLLYRRHIRVGQIISIGKESNHLEEVDAGLIHSPESVYTVYSDPKRDSWEREIRPKLKAIPLSVLINETGMRRRALINARTGKTRPHVKNQKKIEDAVNKLLMIHRKPRRRIN